MCLFLFARKGTHKEAPPRREVGAKVTSSVCRGLSETSHGEWELCAIWQQGDHHHTWCACLIQNNCTKTPDFTRANELSFRDNMSDCLDVMEATDQVQHQGTWAAKRICQPTPLA